MTASIPTGVFFRRVEGATGKRATPDKWWSQLWCPYMKNRSTWFGMTVHKNTWLRVCEVQVLRHVRAHTWNISRSLNQKSYEEDEPCSVVCYCSCVVIKRRSAERPSETDSPTKLHVVVHRALRSTPNISGIYFCQRQSWPSPSIGVSKVSFMQLCLACKYCVSRSAKCNRQRKLDSDILKQDTECDVVNVSLTLEMCVQSYFDGLAQDCCNSIANAVGLLQSCAKASICFHAMHYNVNRNSSAGGLGRM